MTVGESELLRTAIIRLRARILALTCGLFCGTGLFVATAGLLLHGGENVGQHLRLLNNYCPGYDVTWPGAVIGFFYGLLYGAVLGYAVAWVYNRVAARRQPQDFGRFR